MFTKTTFDKIAVSHKSAIYQQFLNPVQYADVNNYEFSSVSPMHFLKESKFINEFMKIAPRENEGRQHSYLLSAHTFLKVT